MIDYFKLCFLCGIVILRGCREAKNQVNGSNKNGHYKPLRIRSIKIKRIKRDNDNRTFTRSVQLQTADKCGSRHTQSTQIFEKVDSQKAIAKQNHVSRELRVAANTRLLFSRYL